MPRVKILKSLKEYVPVLVFNDNLRKASQSYGILSLTVELNKSFIFPNTRSPIIPSMLKYTHKSNSIVDSSLINALTL